MTKIIYILLSFLGTVLSAPLNCIQSLGGGFFDLSPLESSKDYELQVNSNLTLIFNICNYAHRQCGTKFTFGNIFHKTQALSCLKLTNSTKLYGVEYALLNEQKANQGLRMTFTGGDFLNATVEGWSPITQEEIDANPTKRFSMILSMKCDYNADPLAVENWDFDSVHFAYSINIKTKHACPVVTMAQVTQFLNDYSPLFMVVGLAIGLCEALFGLKYFNPTLFLFGFLTGFLVSVFIFFSQVVTPDSRESTKWILVLFSMILGVCLGYITVKLNKAGTFLMGTWFGIMLGMLCYNSFLYHFDDANATVFWVTLLVFAAMGGALAHKQQKYLIILASSFCGSYIAVRSLSIQFGGFPNEADLIQAIQLQDEHYSVDWPFYVYLNAIISFSLVSGYFQIKQKRKRDKKKEEDEFEMSEYIKNED